MEEVTGCPEHEALIFEDSEEGRRLNNMLYDAALMALAEEDWARCEAEMNRRREHDDERRYSRGDRDEGGEA